MNKDIIARGGFFTKKDEKDEFFLEFNGEEMPVFKEYQYLSLPFKFSGKEHITGQLIERAKNNKTSFYEEILKDEDAKKIMDNFFYEMEHNPSFTKQIIDVTLPQVYIQDTLMNEVGFDNTLEGSIAKVISAWEHLSDFYCIEGLVGGDGKINPLKKGNGSALAGFIDDLEDKLPYIKSRLDNEDWTKSILQLSHVIGREYTQIDDAVDLLSKIKKPLELDEDELKYGVESIDSLVKTNFVENLDIASFYNTLIRFHNWMPSELKKGKNTGDSYDSTCKPSKVALAENKNIEIGKLVSEMSNDATSPKGVALSIFANRKEIGDKKEIEKLVNSTNFEIDNHILHNIDEFYTLTYEDPTFYEGLVGGKWKGLKMLHDTKKALGLNYELPEGYVITSIGINKFLEDAGILSILEENSYKLNKNHVKEINKLIDDNSLDEKLLEPAKKMSDNLIARSSMYGEDGDNNYAGVYESIGSNKENLESSIKGVIKSYFTSDAIFERRNHSAPKNKDKVKGVNYGILDYPNISVIVLDIIEGESGVLIYNNGDSEISQGKDVVNGKYEKFEKGSMEEIIKHFDCKTIKHDLKQLHNLYGGIDVEYVSNNEGIHLVQMRALPENAEQLGEVPKDCPIIEYKSFDDIKDSIIDYRFVAKLDFLKDENCNDRQLEIYKFMKRNEDTLEGIKGALPGPSHIPNRIRSRHAPYEMIDI
ncbi:hypothetical protein C0585_03615 [Candidatus Woesearchaeota archaeon]|nr:MAG: hypothetical protein C0585_03615 [Candidatus Woesearchaeota archaeon]